MSKFNRDQYNRDLSWIANLQVKDEMKLALLRGMDQDINVDDDSESEDVSEVSDEDSDDIAVITDGIGSHQDNQGRSSFLQGCKNGPRKFVWPRFSDGTLVGLPNIPSKRKITGFHSEDQDSDRPKVQKKPKTANGFSMEPITNPGFYFDILSDSDGCDDSAEANLWKLPLSAFKRNEAMSSIPFDRASSVMGAFSSSVNCTSPSFSTSSKSVGKLCTADEVIRQKQKEVYKKLYDIIDRDPKYCPVKTSQNTAIQKDLTGGDDEEAVRACSVRGNLSREDFKEFLEKYYPRHLTRTIVKCPPMIKEESRKTAPPPSSTLPQLRPEEQKSKRKERFSAEWLQELKLQIVEETKMRMEIVKQDEVQMKRLRDQRDARHQEAKRLFDKFKVPGDVFPEPAWCQALSKEREDTVNAVVAESEVRFNGSTSARKDMLTLNPGTRLNDEQNVGRRATDAAD